MPKWLWNGLSWFCMKLAFTWLIHFVRWKHRWELQARSGYAVRGQVDSGLFFGPQFPCVSTTRVGQTSDLNPVKNKGHLGSLLECSCGASTPQMPSFCVWPCTSRRASVPFRLPSEGRIDLPCASGCLSSTPIIHSRKRAQESPLILTRHHSLLVTNS